MFCEEFFLAQGYVLGTKKNKNKKKQHLYIPKTYANPKVMLFCLGEIENLPKEVPHYKILMALCEVVLLRSHVCLPPLGRLTPISYEMTEKIYADFTIISFISS